jgi:phosphohistidine phosphatase
MERLILMRHGEAVRPAPGLEDFDRALDAEGLAEARLMGEALAREGIEPDLALVSSARRTLETWRAVAESFARPIDLQEDRSLYAASASRLAAAARLVAPRGRTLMMVGHNPGIHQYAVHLARQAGASAEAVRPLYDRFPTGSIVVFGMDKNGRPSFERLLLARDFRGKLGWA